MSQLPLLLCERWSRWFVHTQHESEGWPLWYVSVFTLVISLLMSCKNRSVATVRMRPRVSAQTSVRKSVQNTASAPGRTISFAKRYVHSLLRKRCSRLIPVVGLQDSLDVYCFCTEGEETSRGRNRRVGAGDAIGWHQLVVCSVP